MFTWVYFTFLIFFNCCCPERHSYITMQQFVYEGSATERAVFMMSGGIDSPPAAYLGASAGWEPVFVYFDGRPFTGEDTMARALRTIRRVEEACGKRGKTLIIPHGRDLEEIQKCRRNLSCVLCKRMMYRKAERVAQRFSCSAIVTGEILGEQASQTMHNLVVDSMVVDVPIVRPLIGMNKREVEAIARRIGTFEISTSKAQECSAQAIKARTRARPEEILKEEADMPIEMLIEEALRSLG